MTEEDKKLLLKDLSARLPYGVKIHSTEYSGVWNIFSINPNGEVYVIDYINSPLPSYYETCKPYLFPMSSITEEQEEELKNIYYRFNGMFQYTERIFDRIPFSKMKYFPYQVEEFFNKNHIDYRGLIPMGLAKDATGLGIY